MGETREFGEMPERVWVYDWDAGKWVHTGGIIQHGRERYVPFGDHEFAIAAAVEAEREKVEAELAELRAYKAVVEPIVRAALVVEDRQRFVMLGPRAFAPLAAAVAALPPKHRPEGV